MEITIRSDKHSSPTLPPELIEFAQEVGNFIEYWGFKNVQGQIWAYLYLSDQPLEVAELMRRTGISKGLASLYLKEMLSYGVIEEVGKGSYGRVFYRANADQDAVIFNVLRKRERTLIARVQSAWERCQKLSKNEKAEASLSDLGLKRAGQMISNAVNIMDVMIRSHETLQVIASRIKLAFSRKKEAE